MADKKISQLTAATTPLAGTEVLPVVQGSSTVKVAVSDLTAGRAVSMASGTVTGDLTVDTNTLKVDSTNNRAGFGTATPNYPVDILSTLSGTTAGSNAILSVSSNGDGRDAHIRLNDNVNASARIGTLASNLYLWTVGAPRLTVSTAGNVSVNTGNLVIGTSGKGIDFSATPGTGTSELLADYEEGTFTPTIEGSSTAGTASYSAQSATYTKVGRWVQFQIYLVWTGGTGTGELRVGGLPFTAAAGTSAYGGVTIPFMSDVALTASNYCSGAYVLSSDNKIRFIQTPVGGGAVSAISYDAAGEFMLIGSYIV